MGDIPSGVDDHSLRMTRADFIKKFIPGAVIGGGVAAATAGMRGRFAAAQGLLDLLSGSKEDLASVIWRSRVAVHFSPEDINKEGSLSMPGVLVEHDAAGVVCLVPFRTHEFVSFPRKLKSVYIGPNDQSGREPGSFGYDLEDKGADCKVVALPDLGVAAVILKNRKDAAPYKTLTPGKVTEPDKKSTYGTVNLQGKIPDPSLDYQINLQTLAEIKETAILDYDQSMAYFVDGSSNMVGIKSWCRTGPGSARWQWTSMEQISKEITRSLEKEVDLRVEVATKLEEIVKSRQAIGLDGLPEELAGETVDSIVNAPDVWMEAGELTEQNIPVTSKSCVQYTRYVLQALFGEHAYALVQSIQVDPNDPLRSVFRNQIDSGRGRYYQMYRDPHRRYNGLANITDSGPSFISNVAHEALGHGGDSDDGAKYVYSPLALVRAAHARWGMTAEVFSVPGQFFLHPADGMLPALQASFGETIAREMIDMGKIGEVISRNNESIFTEIMQIAKEKGVGVGDLKYNLEVCRRIGKLIIDLVCLKKQAYFVGKYQDDYRHQIYGPVNEMFAEAIRHSIVDPDDYESPLPQNVHDLVGQFFSNISGKTWTRDSIRQLVFNPPREISERYEAEEAIVNAGVTSTPISAPLSAEELAAIEAAREKEIRLEMAYQDFITQDGYTPDIVDVGLRGQMAEYASYINKIFDTYQRFDLDPSGLHVWEFRDVQNDGLNLSGVREWVRLIDEKTPEGIRLDDVTRRLKLLKWFVDESGAFGT